MPTGPGTLIYSALVTVMIAYSIPTVYVLTASAAALTGAVCDVRTRRIPNAVTGPAILAGLVLHFGLDGWRGMGLAAAAGLIAGVIFLTFLLAGRHGRRRRSIASWGLFEGGGS